MLGYAWLKRGEFTGDETVAATRSTWRRLASGDTDHLGNVFGFCQCHFLTIGVPDLGIRLDQEARSVTLSTSLKGSVNIHEFGLFWIVPVEALKVSGQFAAIPDVSIGMLGVPVIGVLNDRPVFSYDVINDTTLDSVNELHFVRHNHRNRLTFIFVDPGVPDDERPVGVRYDRAANIVRIDEVSWIEVRVIRLMANEVADFVAGIEDTIALLKGITPV